MTQNNYNELYQMFDDLYKGVKKVKNDEYLHQEAEKFKQDKDYLEKNQHLMTNEKALDLIERVMKLPGLTLMKFYEPKRKLIVEKLKELNPDWIEDLIYFKEVYKGQKRRGQQYKIFHLFWNMMKNIDEENFEEAQKLKTEILKYNEKPNLS